MSRLPVPGEDADIWGDVLNDFLAVSHLDDGRIRVSALPAPQVADGSITPVKLSQAYVPVTDKGAASGVATLDGTGKVPLAQMPAGAAVTDATTTTKGIVQLAGDLAGTADAPTVPGLAAKYVKPAGGIPETDLDSNVQTKLNTGGAIGDATSSVKGVLQLAGDLSGTASAPTVPGKVNTSSVGAANGVASLDGTGRVPVSQLPSGLEPDATTTVKGIVQLAGDLAGTADAPTVPGLASKANDIDVVHKAGNETITGVKVFTSLIEIPGPPVKLTDATNKAYVDSLVPSGGVSDATTTTKGIVQLAGDLAGTADAPTVPGLAAKIDTSAKGANNGVATLDGTGKVPAAQIPTPSDATTLSKGIIQLAGDLSGTAAAPTVPGLSAKVSTASVGAAGGVASLDGSGKVPVAQLPATGSRIQAFSSSGLLMTEPGAHRLYNDSGSAWTVLSVRASVGQAPTGSSIIVDVDINGTTIFTTQANRPTIPAAGNTSGKVTNMDVTTVANGDYLTVDVDQVGSTTPGSDLTVQVEVS